MANLQTMSIFDTRIAKAMEILYHPIEYLGIDKKLITYLKLGFNREGFVGLGDQVLIAHILAYVQRFGQQQLWKFEHYKKEYNDALLNAMTEKDISIGLASHIIIDADKLSNISMPGKSHRPSDREFSQSNVRMSSNYEQFHLLPFNRKKKESHVLELMESIKQFGILSYGVVVETDLVDGVMRKWIADGQHRMESEERLGLPFYYTMTTVKSLEELVLLVAKLNATSKPWPISQYLETWASLKAPDYVTLRNTQMETKIQISILLEIFSGKDRRMAKKLLTGGKFSIPDIAQSKKFIKYILDIRTIPSLPKSRVFSSALLKVFKESTYNHQVFVNNLKEKKTMIFSEDEQMLYKQIASLAL